MLAADGWFLVRQRGSHRQYHHPHRSWTVSVAGQPSVGIPPRTPSSTLKKSRLEEVSRPCNTLSSSRKVRRALAPTSPICPDASPSGRAEPRSGS
ncbi:MAG: type II toxin-antitoxin system HicA family toxin [Pelomonas sp.]|nr:type II toxin-antitoxin system HicA family toxin [Roseateles sp.]